jgi:hypothetical protein
LRAQNPKLEALTEGQFAWEPLDASAGWLDVKGPLEKLEWAVRTQGIYAGREVHNITIRNLHARHALNDGYSIHGNAEGLRLLNVTRASTNTNDAITCNCQAASHSSNAVSPPARVIKAR